MEHKQHFKLIDGKFSPSESTNILFALINSKINFHALGAFSAQERGTDNMAHHNHRIKELNDTYSDIKTIINFASENNLTLKINSKIEITLIK